MKDDLKILSLLHTTGLFQYNLNSLKNKSFSVFRGYRKMSGMKWVILMSLQKPSFGGILENNCPEKLDKTEQSNPNGVPF